MPISAWSTESLILVHSCSNAQQTKRRSACVTCTLNVVVKREVTVAVFLQQTKRISVGKVFKLYQRTLTIPTQTQTETDIQTSVRLSVWWNVL